MRNNSLEYIPLYYLYKKQIGDRIDRGYIKDYHLVSMCESAESSAVASAVGFPESGNGTLSQSSLELRRISTVVGR